MNFRHLGFFNVKLHGVFAFRRHRNTAAAAGIEPATSISAVQFYSHSATAAGGKLNIWSPQI